jgi:hypothetical protein
LYAYIQILSLLNVKFLIKKPGRRAGRVAQVEDCLTSKCETLSSNPSTTKKKKKRKPGRKIPLFHP